jgi:hypothetical protein
MKWAFAGAGVGVAVPAIIRVYEVLQFGHVRPVVFCFLWPTTFVAGFKYPHAPLVLAPVILGNTLLFGGVAAASRRAFVVVLVAILIVVWLFLPPSDAVLARRFDQQRATLQRLVEMSKHDPEIVRLTSDRFETSDGKTYSIGDGETLLPNRRWSEYRQKLGALRMHEVMFRRAGSGEVYVAAQTHGVGPIRSYYGYLYCPGISVMPTVYVPCTEGNDSADRDAYRYKTLGFNWYVFKVFSPYEIE